jgi:hypothetical protein
MLAFMSCEKLANITFYADLTTSRSGRPSNAQAEHSHLAPRHLHDLESVFWVLCFICITRDGPGQWREALKDETSPARNVVCRIFEPTETATGGNLKMNILIYDGEFESKISENCAPYFQRLDELLWQFGLSLGWRTMVKRIRRCR